MRGSAEVEPLIGIDWGGTKIEGIAMTVDGKEIVRLREPTPRHDYEGCIQIILHLVNRLEREAGRRRGSVGIGIPGSLDQNRVSAKARARRGC